MSAYKHEIIVFGASGNLAKRKLYPGLHSLFIDGHLPHTTRVIGYGRTSLFEQQDAFREHITKHITRTSKTNEFLNMCSYISGQYDVVSRHLIESQHENVNRLFYLSIPPKGFLDVATNIPAFFSTHGWNRVLIEKPFGEDMSSFQQLKRAITKYIPEENIYCVDHYLGKPVVRAIPLVRQQSSHIWNTDAIESIDILFSEQLGIDNREYFDGAGIIRDVVQNHLVQLIALILSNDKVDTLKNITTANTSLSSFGQYDGYLNEMHVAPNSTTPTYFSTVVNVHGIPVRLTAGKAMRRQVVEITIGLKTHEHIHINVQPECYIEVDGQTWMYNDTNAYINILKAGMEGDRSMFVTFDEIEESWRIFENVLDANIVPSKYTPGIRH